MSRSLGTSSEKSFWVPCRSRLGTGKYNDEACVPQNDKNEVPDSLKIFNEDVLIYVFKVVLALRDDLCKQKVNYFTEHKLEVKEETNPVHLPLIDEDENVEVMEKEKVRNKFEE